jgi:eukaryotic-like serine/threonine-protein kinase
MTNLRERWEGVSLPGDYLLERWVSGNDDAGFFETPPAPDGRRAIVKLVPEPAVDAAAQLALWQHTRQLRHPNLQELRDCGRAELTGETVLYAVFEYADDTLADALSQKPLSENEAREVLDALVGGLGYLQSNGLAYPAIEPDRVIAVGERIKLSTDALRETPAGTPYTDELRAFWYKISPCSVARSADILVQALGGIAPLADAATQPAALAAAASTQRGKYLAPSPPNPFPKWILVGAVGVVLLILGLNLRRTPDAPAQPPTAQQAPAAIVAAPVPKASPAREAKSKPSPPGNGTWRVIVFTYRTHDAATRKAEQLNKRHPELKAAVLSPRGKNGNYVISLGGPMSRGDAERMQKKARAARVARDVRVESGLD